MGARTLTPPRFGLVPYRSLLDDVRSAGWSTAPVREMPRRAPRTVYLRHDVDFQLAAVEAMAAVEAAADVQATYFVLLSGPYNAFALDNQARLRALVEQGHEVGLHYDLVGYPETVPAARRRLAWECGLLGELTGCPVRSVCMHQPSMNRDILREGSGFIHPHDDAWGSGLEYRSDSCRAWRDDVALWPLPQGGADRLLLNTHPELWLDETIDEGPRYLDEIVLPLLLEPARRYIEDVVDPVWRERALRG